MTITDDDCAIDDGVAMAAMAQAYERQFVKEALNAPAYLKAVMLHAMQAFEREHPRRHDAAIMTTRQEWKFDYANRRVTSISVIHHPDKTTATEMINDALLNRRHEHGIPDYKDAGEGVFGIDDKGAFVDIDRNSPPFRWSHDW